MIRRNAASRCRMRMLAAVLAAAAAAPLKPASAQTDTNNLPLFSDSSTLQLRLEAPLRALRRDSQRSRPERDGFIRYTDTDGNEVVLEVEVRVRGRSRLAECDFPPLRLDFRRRQLDGTILEGQNRLKLVTLCKSRDSYRDYVHLEHDVYRLLNVLTDYSFRVRNVDMEYVSTDSRREEILREPAFLIETDQEVAARHGLEVLEQESFRPEELDSRHAALVSVFQFIIGNTDWSMLDAPGNEDCCHNADVIGNNASPAIALPYDFDQSGLISTEYARPPEMLRIRNVRQRVYRGVCDVNAELDIVYTHIANKRTDLEYVLQVSKASESARNEALAYLKEALDILADPQLRNAAITEQCR